MCRAENFLFCDLDHLAKKLQVKFNSICKKPSSSDDNLPDHS